MVRLFLLIGIFLSVSSLAFAQARLSFTPIPTSKFTPEKSFFQVQSLTQNLPGIAPERILPAYVRANPGGLSYFCRMELEIERKLPVGIWMKITEHSGLAGDANSRVNLRLRLLDF